MAKPIDVSAAATVNIKIEIKLPITSSDWAEMIRKIKFIDNKINSRDIKIVTILDLFIRRLLIPIIKIITNKIKKFEKFITNLFDG
jgi:hypothetical protein